MQVGTGRFPLDETFWNEFREIPNNEWNSILHNFRERGQPPRERGTFHSTKILKLSKRGQMVGSEISRMQVIGVKQLITDI